eukprot:14785-Heterococcus_DN1.PRE.5
MTLHRPAHVIACAASLLFTGFPSATERAEIVLALARAMPLGDGAAEALHSGAAADTAALLSGADLQ